MAKTIVVLRGFNSRYDVLNCFADEITQAYKELGYEVVSVYMSGTDTGQELCDALSNHDVFFVFSMSGMTLDYKPICDLYDEFDVPVFSFYVDHPIYQEGRISTSIRHSLVSVIASEHLDYLQANVSCNAYTCTVPHGAILGDSNESIPFLERPIDVLVAGSYVDHNKMQEDWKETIPSGVQSLMNLVIDRMCRSNALSLFQAFADTVKDIGMDVKDFDHMFVRSLMLQADRFLRSFWRERLISSVRDVPIHVFGEGWENASLGSNAIVLPSMPYQKIVSLMRQSKIVLDIHPYILGAHERTFQAMNEGALVLGVETPYMQEHFRDTAVMFRPYEMSLGSQIEHVLSNLPLMSEMAKLGMERVRGSHLWINRAMQIIEHVNRYREMTMS